MSEREQRYLGVECQNCGEPIPVPARLMNRQIIVADDDSNPLGRYVSTLLNLRCRACLAEHFYDASEICEMERRPQPFSRFHSDHSISRRSPHHPAASHN